MMYKTEISTSLIYKIQIFNLLRLDFVHCIAVALSLHQQQQPFFILFSAPQGERDDACACALRALS